MGIVQRWVTFADWLTAPGNPDPEPSDSGALPRFTVHRVDTEQQRLIGTVSRSTHWDGRKLGSGDLHIGDEIIEGRWTRQKSGMWVYEPMRRVVSEENDTIDIKLVPRALPRLGAEREFEVWDGYWGERAELVLDPSLEWTPKHWTDDHQETYDHRHCSFCWANIDGHTDSDDCHSEYFDSGYLACPPCYTLFVEPRSLDFTPIGGPAGRR